MERYNVCATFKSISLELKLSCKVIGRMVQLWMESGILHIREMEVFANWWWSFPGATVISMSVASKKVTLSSLGTSNDTDTRRIQLISPSFT